MPGYVEKALARFKHSKARKIQDQPHKHAIPVYGATVQYTKEADTTQLLDKKRQEIHPTSCRNVSVLWKGGRWNNATST